MGQYYKAIVFKDNKIKAVFKPHSFNNGARLTEHSYIGNEFVNAVSNYLIENKGCKLLWAGNYADEIPTETFKDKEGYEGVYEYLVNELNKSNITYKDREEIIANGWNWYEITNAITELHPELLNPEIATTNPLDNGYGYLINETTNQYIDLWECIELDGLAFNPMCLLTCGDNANGRGGGDYHGVNENLLGTWWGDVITLDKGRGYWHEEPLGYEEIKTNFYRNNDVVNEIIKCINLLNIPKEELEKTINYNTLCTKIYEMVNKIR